MQGSGAGRGIPEFEIAAVAPVQRIHGQVGCSPISC
jgi:hypothetical protein